MVQGPLPVIEIEPVIDAVPTVAALTKPGAVESEVCGAVQPAGTTTVASDPAVNAFVPLRKLKVNVLPVLLGCTLVGDTVMVPSPFASVNVAEAVSWEESPVAVACNVAPIKSEEKMYQLV